MLSVDKIKKSSLNNSSYVIEESKKSKGKESLINKIRVFSSYVKNILIYHDNIDLDTVSDDRLKSYIDFLNEKNITIEKAVMEIHDKYKEMEEGQETLSDEEERIAIEKDQAKLDELSYKKQIIENKIAQAEAERQAREDFEQMEQEELLERISDAEVIEPEPIIQSETEFSPIEPISEEAVLPVEELVKETHFDFGEVQSPEPVEVNPSVSEVQPSEKVEAEPNESEVQIQEEKNISEEAEPISMVEQPDPEEQIMMDIQNDYENNVEQIKNTYTENLGKEVSNIVEKIMVEAEVYASRQVEEISKISKQAIDTANSNTQKVLDEKAVVENDRDQYKSHYEQTLEVVKEKNEVIDSKDNEISTLRGEITKKDNIISSKEKDIEELNASLNDRDERIASLESEIDKFKITIATLTRELGRNFQYENLTASPIEEEAVSKTK